MVQGLEALYFRVSAIECGQVFGLQYASAVSLLGLVEDLLYIRMRVARHEVQQEHLADVKYRH